MNDDEARIITEALGCLLARRGGCRFPPPLQAIFLEDTAPLPAWPTVLVTMS